MIAQRPAARSGMVALGLMVAVSCDSAFDPSAPGFTRLNQLSDQEATQLCMEGLAYFRAHSTRAMELEDACRDRGIRRAFELDADATEADARTACQLGYQACEADPPPLATDFSTVEICANAVELGVYRRCAATVEQYAACENESIRDYPRFFSCFQLTKAKLAALTNEGGPACQAFSAACTPESASALTAALKRR